MDKKKLQKEKVIAKKNNAALNIIIIILLAIIIVSSAIGLYAWAKYTSSINGTATAQVAKWNFNLKLKEGKKGATETEGPIDLATTEYNHISNKRIAPGTKGEFEIILDTTGTEVSLVYDVDIDITNCPRNMSFTRKYVDDETGETVTEVLSEGNGVVEETTRNLRISRYLPVKETNYAGKSHTETIMWDWPYELKGEDVPEEDKVAYDERDKAIQGKTTTMSITATATQVEKPSLLSQITVDNYGDSVDYSITINKGKADEVTLDNWKIFSKDANNVYMIYGDYLPNKAVIETVFSKNGSYGIARFIK